MTCTPGRSLSRGAEGQGYHLAPRLKALMGKCEKAQRRDIPKERVWLPILALSLSFWVETVCLKDLHLVDVNLQLIRENGPLFVITL